MLAFQDILGHDSIKQHFQKAIELHKVSHAYILAGEAGWGGNLWPMLLHLLFCVRKEEASPA